MIIKNLNFRLGNMAPYDLQAFMTGPCQSLGSHLELASPRQEALGSFLPCPYALASHLAPSPVHTGCSQQLPPQPPPVPLPYLTLHNTHLYVKSSHLFINILAYCLPSSRTHTPREQEVLI